MTVTKPKVLFIGDLNRDLPEYIRFQKTHECIHYRPTTAEDVIAKFNDEFGDIDAIYGAWKGFFGVGGLYGALLDACPPLLKVISICLVGYDGYDGGALRSRGITLTNVPLDMAADPVADLAAYFAIASFHQYHIYLRYFTSEHNHTVEFRRHLEGDGPFDSKNGKVMVATKELDQYSYGELINDRPCRSPRGHHAVIVGFGNIGQTIASRLSSLGMEISYVKRTPLAKNVEAKLPFKAQYYPTVRDTSIFADLVVIACPASPETYHMIDQSFFEGMQKPFRLINVGRGLVVDENALVHGLELGKVLFAGLDVYEKEPQVDLRLFGRDDVMLMPHIGASTIENFDYTAVQAMRNIENVLTGGTGINTVN